MLEQFFEFKKRESEIYQEWEKAGIFKLENARDASAPVFDITMPPPNANGELHLGHSYGYTVMDTFGRYHRMKGERVLLLPGKDHAGIQTQVVFEKKLRAEGVEIEKMSRSEFFDKCYAFCMDRSNYMRKQEKVLGTSADFEKEMFTLDPKISKVVYQTFKKMYDDGLVYKGSRIVHWSVFSQTAISDVEIEYKEEMGNLWHISYPLVEKFGDINEIIVATTRPETMLGDTAIAVNPNDEKYQGLIGRKVLVPIANREIPIIADERVEMAFGTGAVKVTPAHDFADFEMGQDHKLEQIQVINRFGKMTDLVPEKYQEMTTLECRAELVKDLESAGFLVKIEPLKHMVPIAERGKDIIEPLISEQWFINVNKQGNSLREKALALVKSGKLKVYPESANKLFVQWLENLHDWNISRQILWGHQMPIWYKNRDTEKEEIFVGIEAPEGADWVQESDTFDTWFSSGQWPYSTLASVGLLDLENPSGNAFFPTHTMVMGRDILLFWACRMILFAAYRFNDIPWKNIYFTGLIRDEHGQKMSKSKGNGIEPAEMIEKYGVDALRMSFIAGNKAGMDIRFNEKKVEGYSKFVNKLWNAAKLVEMKLEDGFVSAPIDLSNLQLESSKWILSELSLAKKALIKEMEKYNPSGAFENVYRFVWDVFCSWYLEIMKLQIEESEANKAEIKSVLSLVFKEILVMLQPFAPFVTEELYLKMKCFSSTSMLANETFSVLDFAEYSGDLNKAFAVISAVRAHRKALNLNFSSVLRIKMELGISEEGHALISKMAKTEDDMTLNSEYSINKPIGNGSVLVATTPEQKKLYLEKIQKQYDDLQKIIAADGARLASDFAEKAPEELVTETRERHEENLKAVEILKQELTLN